MADAEVSKNAKGFRAGLLAQIGSNFGVHKTAEQNKIDNGYSRLTVLQAFRGHILNQMTDGAKGFFTEAQSDGLTSQVLICSGMGRSALKSLRSLIENLLRSIYYNDHPIVSVVR